MSSPAALTIFAASCGDDDDDTTTDSSSGGPAPAAGNGLAATANGNGNRNCGGRQEIESARGPQRLELERGAQSPVGKSEVAPRAAARASSVLSSDRG